MKYSPSKNTKAYLAKHGSQEVPLAFDVFYKKAIANSSPPNFLPKPLLLILGFEAIL